MKTQYPTLVLVSILLCLSMTIFSQSVLSSSDGSIRSDNFNVDWTIGETSITTVSGENYFTQGFHQPYTICNPCDNLIPESEFTIVNKREVDLSNSLFIYPNPVIQDMNLELFVPASGLWYLAFYDLTGSLIQLDQQFLNANRKTQRVIDVSAFKSGTYYTRLYKDYFSITQKFQVYH